MLNINYNNIINNINKLDEGGIVSNININNNYNNNIIWNINYKCISNIISRIFNYKNIKY